MDYEQMVKFLSDCFERVAALQEDYLARVATRPDSTLAEIKFEAGRLRGMGNLMSYVEVELKRVKQEGEIA